MSLASRRKDKSGQTQSDKSETMRWLLYALGLLALVIALLLAFLEGVGM
jgi:hypothetical protein